MERRSIDPVQESYATALTWVVRIGFVAMFVTFALYVSGLASSDLPVGQITEHWRMSAEEFQAATGMRAGWRWVTRLGDGATLAFAAVVLFPVSVIVALVVAVLNFLRHRVPVYAAIAAVLAVVLVFAATGMFAAGR